MQTHYHPERRLFATEVFTGPERGKVFDAMDRRDGQLKAEGYQLLTRKAIGRNSPCHCGSGLKFKKCCIDKATVV